MAAIIKTIRVVPRTLGKKEKRRPNNLSSIILKKFVGGSKILESFKNSKILLALDILQTSSKWYF